MLPPSWVARKRNSSSNWSTTTSSFSCSPSRASRATFRIPSEPLLSVASMIASASSGDRPMPASESTSFFASSKARFPIGLPPGLITAMRQPEPAPFIIPPRSAGIKPARINEDLPLPEVPTTARNRARERREINSSACPSRPKNKRYSFVSNGRRPGKGLLIGFDPIIVALLPRNSRR